MEESVELKPIITIPLNKDFIILVSNCDDDDDYIRPFR